MPARLAEHFEDLEKQTHAARLGMWVFLSSEAMLFAALFALYAAYRAAYTADFTAASKHSNLLIGSINTGVLLTSSFVVAMSLDAVRRERPRRAAALLLGAAAMGFLFLVLKGIEYTGHVEEGIAPGDAYSFAALPAHGAAIFFTLYYAMTGLHALHVAGGTAILLWLARLARRGDFAPERSGHALLECGALYWHLVDAIWIFLWPIFYLVR
jgi:cytochrome c oxidase subunit 3